MEKILNYINKDFVESVHGNFLNVTEPATGTAYAQLQIAELEEIDKAIKSAEEAFPSWSAISLEERCNWLWKIAEGIEAEFETFAAAESKDSGKPLPLARRVDIPRSISNFKFFAGAAQHFASESHYTPDAGINYTLRKPIGVVGCISPWNLPLYLFTWKIAPALAAGNCVIAKPSDVTPYTAFLLANVCQKIGLPKGVLNIVHGGIETGRLIVAHPKIKAISFTGSTRAGREIAQTAAASFKKVSLELGGKNPNIIFDDADLEEAVKTSVLSSFNNQGQICLCGSRIFVQEKSYEKFRNQFVELVSAMKVGDPNSDDTRIGAVVSKEHLEKVLSYIKLAQEEGGKILTGGKQIQPEGRCKEGFFIAPTIIEGLSFDCRTNQEEIFGPVVTIMPFKDEEDVLMMANSVEYGLSATLWTNDLKRAHRIAEKLECGIVWINSWMERDLRTPFGGVKSSGVGREGGWEAMRFFTEAKNIFIKY
jgi:aminomuconate-semialdehyde/2-hydroxymuconate-6-semialdehyde dehydrogenase